MNYSEKLKDPRWQKKRLEILQRDDFTCQLCQDKETTLHIHHFCYDVSGYPWAVDDSALITYCEMCHAIVEKEKIHPLSVRRYNKVDDILILFVLYDLENEWVLSLYHYYLSKKQLIQQSTFRKETLKEMVLMFKITGDKSGI